MTRRQLQIQVLGKHFYDRGIFGADISTEKVRWAATRLYGNGWVVDGKLATQSETRFLGEVRDEARRLGIENFRSGQPIANILKGV